MSLRKDSPTTIRLKSLELVLSMLMVDLLAAAANGSGNGIFTNGMHTSFIVHAQNVDLLFDLDKGRGGQEKTHG